MLGSVSDVANTGRSLKAELWNASNLFASVACLAILSIKAALIARINVNWDEFYFLSHVHAFVRGELTGIFQLSYVHLFSWLPKINGDEIAQIIIGRGVLIIPLLATAALVAKLASRWASPSVAWVAPLCYLAASPVVRHGASFRADSLLAPLTVGLLVILTDSERTQRSVILAGIVLGVAGAISVKAVLIAPLIVAVVLADRRPRNCGTMRHLATASTRLLSVGAVALCVAGGLLALHALTLTEPSTQTVQTFATNTVRTSILDTVFFPRWDYFRLTLGADRATWILIAGGALVAIVRRSAALVCALSLLPLFFYRNFFPYYYVVMLAPAAVLAAVGVDGLRSVVARGRVGERVIWIATAVAIPLALQAALNLYELRHNDQMRQRELVSTVHKIFPHPVNYVDHSGMIASFRKVNLFMSTWGLETYRERGSSFMREAITRHRAPLLLVNGSVLDPASPRFLELFAEDRRLIEQYYLPYWGPIRVAGAEIGLLPTGRTTRLSLPFSGRYRLETDEPVQIDGELRNDGATIQVPEAADLPSVTVTVVSPSSTTARLVWADARPPPSSTWPMFAPIYTGL